MVYDIRAKRDTKNSARRTPYLTPKNKGIKPPETPTETQLSLRRKTERRTTRILWCEK
jgi:hypothetical protein